MRSNKNIIDLSSPEARKSMAKLITKLFDFWGLPVREQLNLLGLNQTDRSIMTRFRNGDAIPNTRHMVERVGLLLSIHKKLRLLYPYNR
jgi:hypothetical protein